MKLIFIITLFSVNSLAQNAFVNAYDFKLQVYQNGQYQGNLNNNAFDTNSVNNQLDPYGNQFNPQSLDNQYGGGNPFIIQTDE